MRHKYVDLKEEAFSVTSCNLTYNGQRSEDGRKRTKNRRIIQECSAWRSPFSAWQNVNVMVVTVGRSGGRWCAANSCDITADLTLPMLHRWCRRGCAA